MSKIFKSKAFIISAVIVLFLIIAGGLYYFGYYKGYIIKPKLEINVSQIKGMIKSKYKNDTKADDVIE